MATAGLYIGQDRGCAGEQPYTPVSIEQLLADGSEAEGEAEHDDAELPFASHGSASTAAQYLEPALRELGLEQWQLHGGDTAAAMNSLYALLRLHQQLQSSNAGLQDELHKLKVEAKTADKTIQRLQSQSEQKAQEAGGLNIKLRQLDAWYREEMERWNGEREEMTKKCVQLEQRHVQFQHELRRKDGEFERLQKQLAALLSVKERRGSKAGIGSSGPLPTAAPGRLTINSRAGFSSSSSTKGSNLISTGLDTRRATKAELEELHRKAIDAYEADKLELQQEVKALRQTLQRVEREHKDLLNEMEQSSASRTSSSIGCSSHGNSDSAATAGSTGSLPDPAAAFESMQTQLQALQIRKQRITGGCSSLQVHDLQQHAQTANERLLLAKLVEATNIIDEQEQALAKVLKAVATAQGQP